MFEVCNITQESELRNSFASNYITEVALVESSFWNSYHDSYVINLEFPNIISDIVSKPSLNSIVSKNKIDLRSRLVENQKNYIDNLLKLAGEHYE